jgi:DNA-directed RNA polymerase subunit B
MEKSTPNTNVGSKAPASYYWFILESYLKTTPLAHHHIKSYNEFIERDLQKIVDEVGKIEIRLPSLKHEIVFKRVKLGPPRIVESSGAERNIYPVEARIRNLTYAGSLTLEVEEYKNDKLVQTEEIKIGELPIMLKSKYCPLSKMSPPELVNVGEDPRDTGGYFIINGSERVIIGLEDLAPNRIILERKRVGSYDLCIASVFSTTVGYRTRTEVRLKGQNNSIKVYLPGVGEELPLVVLLRALGSFTDKQIAEMVSPLPEIQSRLDRSFEEAEGIEGEEAVLDYIGNRIAYGQPKEIRLRRAEYLLDKILLPHLGMEKKNRLKKAVFLCEMVERVIALRLGWRRPDDRDHYKNKRLRFAGSLMADLMRTAFRRMVRDFKGQIEKMDVKRGYVRSLSSLVSTSVITDYIAHAVATGNWGRRLVGVSQLLDRTNYMSLIGHMRRIQSPLSRSQANFDARDLHPSHWGRIDPCESPEGSNCGLVKNLSLFTSISGTTNREELERSLVSLGLVPAESATEEMRVSYSKVFIDGTFVGYVPLGETFARQFRKLRRKGRFSPEINVAYYEFRYGEQQRGEVYFNCDAGRPRRPLIVVEEASPLLAEEQIKKLSTGELGFDDLVNMGVVELLDAEEEENSYIAINPDEVNDRTTHLEISPLIIFGAVSSFIPFAEHNHSPRNSYEAAMAKQALGYPFSNLPYSCYTTAHFLQFPQAPLVETHTSEYLGCQTRPIGQNFIVAVLSHPYNMEDALIINKSSVQRGLARSLTYHLYEAEAKLYAIGERDNLEIPPSDVKGFRGEEAYLKLDSDGLIPPETEASGNIVLIGRTSPPRFMEGAREVMAKVPPRRDTSVSLKPSHNGVVDQVILTEDRELNRLVKLRIRDYRLPEIGDKFASRSGQKGVVGLMIPQEDMPFTGSGLVPDAILNPHAIPSRMTIGHFMESIFGKAAALSGKTKYGSSFVHDPLEQAQEELKARGFSPMGEEVMYDGRTGKIFRTKVFIGVVYYQRLHHMVKDKIHARSRGQVTLLTHQPTEGRARGGGLRFGEMERDCLVGFGASRLLQDRLMEESDKTSVYVCENCGGIAYYDSKQRKMICRVCGKGASISTVTVPYAFKLLLQEIYSLGIYPRLQLSERV